MWYIIARKDESNVLRRDPAPKVKCKVEQEKPPKMCIPNLWCGTKAGPLGQRKGTWASSKEPWPRKGDHSATSSQTKQNDLGYARTTKSSARNIPTVSTSRMRKEPQERPQGRLRSKVSKKRARWCGMWRFWRKRGNHMMLDNKSEQKWPLTAADYETGSQGSFLFVLIIL